MSKREIAWSYSRLSAFETCPKQFYHKSVIKDVEDPPGEHLKWGNQVHKAFEDYINGELDPIPDWFEKWVPVADTVKNREHKGCKVEAEVEVVFDRNFKRVDWWDKKAWLRSKLDVFITCGDKATVLDWKTGKRRPNSDQLELFATLVFIAFPEINTVTTSFVWLNTGETDSETYHRDQVVELWNGFEQRYERYEQAFEFDNWTPKPSGLCKKWCPVPKSKCPYSGREG